MRAPRYDIWLRNNPRAVRMLMPWPALMALFGIAVLAASCFLASPEAAWRGWGCALGLLMSAVGILVLVLLERQARGPRVAYQDGKLLLFVRFGPPVQVPIELVECFLMGHAPTLLPGEQNAKQQTITLIVRISERAEEWSHVEVHHLLAAWCDSHVTIRGTWCERLSVQVVNQLNQQLAQVQQQRRAASVTT